MLGKHHTKETIAKMSKNRKGKGHFHTQEEKIKIGQKSKINNNIRFVQTKESRIKASLSMKGRFWVNNGIEQKLVKEIGPDRPGRGRDLAGKLWLAGGGQHVRHGSADGDG